MQFLFLSSINVFYAIDMQHKTVIESFDIIGGSK